jgi:DNA-binding transcriptional MerR regulator
MTIMLGGRGRQWTLSDASRFLRQPQHRLIYLCEKGAVPPDFAEAHGRGSSRRFSARNLLEFSVALRLRDLDLSVDAVKAILHTLRSFEKTVRKETPDFDIVEDLRRASAPELRVLVAEGPRIYFTLSSPGRAPRVFGGVALPKGATRRALPSLAELGTGATPSTVQAKVEVNVTEVAKSLNLDT